MIYRKEGNILAITPPPPKKSVFYWVLMGKPHKNETSILKTKNSLKTS
jgi:hypothetical protein